MDCSDGLSAPCKQDQRLCNGCTTIVKRLPGNWVNDSLTLNQMAQICAILLQGITCNRFCSCSGTWCRMRAVVVRFGGLRKPRRALPGWAAAGRLARQLHNNPPRQSFVCRLAAGRELPALPPLGSTFSKHSGSPMGGFGDGLWCAWQEWVSFLSPLFVDMQIRAASGAGSGVALICGYAGKGSFCLPLSSPIENAGNSHSARRTGLFGIK